MLTDAEVAAAAQATDEVWRDANARRNLFGNAIRKVRVTGVRGLDAEIEFHWPVVAVAGVNGTGKTTLLQVASAAYSRAQGGRYYRLGEWIRNELQGDTPPVSRQARVDFSFFDTPDIPVPYEAVNSRWRYPRRGNPQRYVEFIGITNFSPRIEQRGRVHVFQSRLVIRASEPLSHQAIQSISTICGRAFTGGHVHTVGSPNGNWSENLPQLTRDAVTYSEPHMGAGEQKVVRLVRQLERIPRQSLIILEEPELTLHPDAQRGLAWYLMGLARRQGHQILIATHSADIFETLPLPARILLVRGPGGAVDVLPNAKYLAAARELAANVRLNKDIILVEDAVAGRLLHEILLRYSRAVLTHCTVVPVGSANDVRRLVASFAQAGVRVVGVRDADMGENHQANMLSLPGDRSPEELLVSEENILRAAQWVDGIGEAFAHAQVSAQHLNGSARAKKIMEVLPARAGLSSELMTDRLTLAWLANNDAAARELAGRITALFEGQEPVRLVAG